MELSKANSIRISGAGIKWLKLAIVYLIIGVAMGITMGVTRDFTMRPVHAHVNLLGFTTLGLAGLIYSVFPQAGESRLAQAHFWLMNLALPAMLGGLAMVLSGKMALLPLMIAGEIAATLGVLAFAANLFLNLRK